MFKSASAPLTRVGAGHDNEGTNKRIDRRFSKLILASLLLACSASGWATARDQAKRIHDRIAGVPPSVATLNTMEAMITGGDDLGADGFAFLVFDRDQRLNGAAVVHETL